MQAYQDLLARGTQVSQAPYQPFGGQEVAPITQEQLYGVGNVNTSAQGFTPYAGQAGADIAAAGTPITAQDIANYYNPFQQNVVGATEQQFNLQNAQQLAGVKGNAGAQNALGGNREAVAEALTTQGQNITQAPVIAGLEQQGYVNAQQMALLQKQQQLAGGLGLSSANLQQAGAQIGAGTMQQQTQQAQDTQAMTDYYTQQGYPFATAQWLAGIVLGTGPQMGQSSFGTSVTQGPQPNQLLQGAGLGVAALGMFAKKGGRVSGFADGGGPLPWPKGQGWIPTMGKVGGVSLHDPGVQAPKMAAQDNSKTLQSIGTGLGKIGGSLYDNPMVSSLPATWGGFDSTENAGVGLSADESNPSPYAHGGRIGFDDGGGLDNPDNLPSPPGYGEDKLWKILEQAGKWSGGKYGRQAAQTAQGNQADYISSVVPRRRGFDDGGDVPISGLLGGYQNFDERFTGVPPLNVTTPSAGFPDAAPTPLPTPKPSIPVGVEPTETAYEKPTGGYADKMDRIAAAHRKIESDNNYFSVGQPSPKDGDRPYGAYQVMGKNIPDWTEQYLGTRMSPQQFLKNPEAQDALYKAKMGQYIDQFGLKGALDHWLGVGKSDYLGTTHPEYQRRFANAFAGEEGGEVTPVNYRPGVGGTNQLSARARNYTFGLAPGAAAAPEGAPATPTGGGGLLNLSSEAKQGLISMGLGMMANRVGGRGSFLAGVGQGGEQGMQTYASARAATLGQQNLQQQREYQHQREEELMQHHRALEQHQSALENQGNYTITAGTGLNPETGEQVPGTYKLNKKTGETTFEPGKILGKTPVTPPHIDPFATPETPKAPTKPTEKVPQSELPPTARAIQFDPEAGVDPTKPLNSDQIEKGRDQHTQDLTEKLKVVEDIHEPGTHPEVLDNVKKNLGSEGAGVAGLIKAVSEGRLKLESLPSRNVEYNGQKYQLRDLVGRGLVAYNPGWEQGRAVQRATTMKDLAPNGKTGQLILGVNQLIPHMGTAVKAAIKLDNSAYPAANTIRNWWLTQTGDPRVREFQTVRDVAAVDAARILRGSGVISESEIKGWQDRIKEQGSPRQLIGVIRMLADDLMGARMSSIQYTYRSLVGKDAPELLSPHAKEALKFISDADARLNAPNAGTEVGAKPIPTQKDIDYVKSHPENKAHFIQQFGREP